MMCPFEPREKQALLEAPGLGDRASILTTLMNFAGSPSGGDGPKSMQ